jgi:hypothetical protein
MPTRLTPEQREILGLNPYEIRNLSMKLNGAIARCGKSKNPNHIKHYQEKGISVCDEWKASRFAFLLWAKDRYKHGLELDRIDNTKGYTPENCRFATAKDSRRHRTNCRSFDELDAIELLKAHGFSPIFIKEHFPMNP